MKNSQLITISFQKSDMEKIKYLRENLGINISHECREAIRKLYEEKIKQQKTIS